MTSLPLCLSFILLFVMQRFLTSSQEMWGCVPGACSIRCGRFPGQSVCHQLRPSGSGAVKSQHPLCTRLQCR